MTEALVLDGFDFALAHTYADNGQFTVEVCVTDDDNATGCETATVTVNNVAPAVDAIADATINDLGGWAGPRSSRGAFRASSTKRNNSSR